MIFPWPYHEQNTRAQRFWSVVLWVVVLLGALAAYVVARADEDPLVAQARDAEARALDASFWLLRDERVAHEADVVGYRARFRRWGDFLEVEVERGGKKYVDVVDLTRVTEIKLVPGHPPDEGGEVTYRIQPGAVDGLCAQDVNCRPRNSQIEWSLPAKRADRPAIVTAVADHSSAFVITATYSTAATFSNYCTTTPTTSSSTVLYYNETGGYGTSAATGGGGAGAATGGGVGGVIYSGLKTEKVARDAVDDAIEFVGAGVALYMPAGLGEDTRAKILDTVREGLP